MRAVATDTTECVTYCGVLCGRLFSTYARDEQRVWLLTGESESNIQTVHRARPCSWQRVSKVIPTASIQTLEIINTNKQPPRTNSPSSSFACYVWIYAFQSENALPQMDKSLFLDYTFHAQWETKSIKPAYLDSIAFRHWGFPAFCQKNEQLLLS